MKRFSSKYSVLPSWKRSVAAKTATHLACTALVGDVRFGGASLYTMRVGGIFIH